MLLSSLIILNCEDRVLFMIINLTGVLCLSFLFNRSLIQVLSFCQVKILFLPFPTGVLYHLFNISSSHQVFLLFSTGVLSKFCHSCSLAISLYRGGHILFVREALISMSFNLQGSRDVPCSSLLTECLQSRSSPLHSSFQFVQPLKVIGFTHFSKKQFSFTSSLPLPFSLRCHPRSRDEILS